MVLRRAWVRGGGLTSVPEQAEAQAGREQQEETSTAQAQPRACVDLGGRYAHTIHHHCPAYGGREAFGLCLGVEGLPDPQEPLPSLPPTFLLLLQLCDLGQVIRPLWALISWRLPESGFPTKRREERHQPHCTDGEQWGTPGLGPPCSSVMPAGVPLPPAVSPCHVAATSEHVHNSAL